MSVILAYRCGCVDYIQVNIRAKMAVIFTYRCGYVDYIQNSRETENVSNLVI